MTEENQDALRCADDICRGERSGMWYESSRAAAHIRRLVARDESTTALVQHSSWVTIITEAYEGGVGKGQQARSLGREIENPWAEGMARTAWQKGYEVGKAQPGNPLAEHWLKQYEWAFHGWEECKKVCDALRDDLVQCGGHQPVGSIVHPEPPPRYPSGAPSQVESNCIQCRNADSWGMPDQPVCKTCVAGSAWVPLNQDSVNPNKPHPDNVAVDRFAQAMKAKLAEARERGRSGWESCPPEELSRMLREHVEKGDTRDVANFCAFLWNRRFPITAAPEAPAQAEGEPQEWIAAGDYRRNVRALDVALNGDGAAEQASLVDVLAQVEQVQRELGKPVLQALAEAPMQAEARDKRYAAGGVFVPHDIAWGIVGSTGHARKRAVDALHASLKAEQAAEPAGYVHPQALERLKNGETVVFRKEPYGGEEQIPVYLGPRGAEAPNPELVDLCHAIVDLHKSNGCVLTVQIEQMAELLEEPKKGGAK